MVWECKTADPTGVPARQLAIIYGETPAGFLQVFPKKPARPAPLHPGRTYFMGATGSEIDYRAVFALPVESPGVRLRGTVPRSRDGSEK